MTRFGIDAPTMLRLIADDVVVPADHTLVAPGAIRSHGLAALLAAVRAGEMSEREALEQHERFTGLKMRLLDDRVSRRTAWGIAMERSLEISTAAYIAVSKLQADALVTSEAALSAAASGLVRVATFEELVAG